MRASRKGSQSAQGRSGLRNIDRESRSRLSFRPIEHGTRYTFSDGRRRRTLDKLRPQTEAEADDPDADVVSGVLQATLYSVSDGVMDMSGITVTDGVASGVYKA